MMGTVGACEERLSSCVLHPVKRALIQFTATAKPLCSI